VWQKCFLREAEGNDERLADGEVDKGTTKERFRAVEKFCRLPKREEGAVGMKLQKSFAQAG